MLKHHALLTVVALSTALAAPIARAETAPAHPCGGGLVTPVHLDPHGDNFLSVLSAPRSGGGSMSFLQVAFFVPHDNPANGSTSVYFAMVVVSLAGHTPVISER